MLQLCRGAHPHNAIRPCTTQPTVPGLPTQPRHLHLPPQERPGHMVAQSAHLIANITGVVIARPEGPQVARQYQLLPGLANAEIISHAGPDLYTRRLLLPMRTPLIHPFLSRRHAELMFKAAKLPRNMVGGAQGVHGSCHSCWLQCSAALALQARNE
jgi:hypothetical protein